MANKIIKLPDKKKKISKKKIIEKLRLKYPRLKQISEDVESIPKKEEKYYPTQKKGIKRYRIAGTLAKQGYVEGGSTGFDRLIGFHLDHVIYRSLKAVYGLPDPITFDVYKEDISKNGDVKAIGYPIEWSYLISGGDGSCIEIKEQFKDYEMKIISWLPLKEKPEKIPENVLKDFTEFFLLFYQLIEIIDNEYSIEEEQNKIEKFLPSGPHRSFVNIYYQNFQAGKDILELTEEWVSEIEESRIDYLSQGQWGEASNIHRKGSILYVSAIVFYLMALEGFVNLLYKFLLKPKFNHRDYERAVWRADFDLRILNLPVYCRGFKKADITPEDDCYKLWLKIRPFRNNLLHANITEENEFTVTFEDWFHFQYNPLLHLKRQKKKKIHTQQLYIRKKHALQIEEIVDQIVTTIINKLDKKEKVWVKSWIDRLEIWFVKEEGKEYLLK